MKKHLSRRLLSLVLALVLCFGLAAPAAAADSTTKLAFEQVDNSLVSASLEDRLVSETAQQSEYAATEQVRVSIVLEDEPTLATFSAENIAENASAMSYRQTLLTRQDRVAQKISTQALKGQELDVVWNLTLAANIISANVQYGQIEAIAAVPGVAEVFVETRYSPDVVETGAADPNMSTSSDMIGSGNAWAAGYTGKGSLIAVIDTGTDTDHQSFDAGAFEYAIAESEEDVDLLTAEDIADVLDQLNIADSGVTADQLYINAKLPFGYNYIDEDLDITHDNDSQGEHGSHVAGIATANRYIPNGDGTYSDALTSVYTQGVAPDAQLITMKVFGKGGGAYDSDYMAAIEDAIVLGADSINLSLGSGNPGFSTNSSSTYQDILDSLAESGAVVCMSAGNSGTWQENTSYGYLYNDGVSMQTDGSPGSYTNSLAVASVTNTGSTGNFLDFGEELSAVSFTESTGYTNAPIASLDTTGSGTTYDFVLFDNVGVDGSGNNLLTDYADITKDKVVMVYRGTSSFYQKHDAAAEVGAIACIVVNNASGTINMDLSDSTATIPCVSITQADGAAVKALSTTTAVTDDDGNTLYYTGKITISSAIKAVQGSAEYYTMSSFSSWGIPGSLELKPEISAPGGNIYSVDGSVAGGQAYENMSGTSMASPQMAGMSAVLAQYIRENDLTTKTGLSSRQLIQSLIMSTAEPMIEEDSGYYYSLLNQGAGLANVNDAINAHSYIVMDDDANAGAADGKVKVELGDDPDKTGIYTFSYTLYNLTDEPSTYTFDTDVFTQDVFDYYGMTFLDTWTAPLSGAAVTYTVNGIALDASTDDVTYTGDDVQAVLDYISGAGTLSSAQKASYDLDGNSAITSYDAYLMLNLVNGAAGVAVPAQGSIHVTVTIDVTQCDFSNYPTGAYIEAYSYATETSSAEGVEGTVHSIPVLGYYGNWSDPSMYDVGTLADYWYGTESRYPYLYNSTKMYTNVLTVKYPGDNSEYYYFGNPMIDDDEYLEERNAFNSDGSLYKYYVSIIRNAGDAMWQVTDANTGEVYASENLGRVNSAYYYSNGSAWYNTQTGVKLDWQGTDADGNKLPEDTEVNISLILAPEYYVTEDGTDWDALGDGAYLTTHTAIDNTAPTMTSLVYDAEAGTLTATASDNRYLAAVALYQNGGSGVLDYVAPNQDLEDKGQSGAYVLDVSELSTGAELYIQLTDYAMNQTTYKFILTENGIDDDVVPATSITLSPTALTLVKGTSGVVNASFTPYMANETVIWTSADESIATVENGVVTGINVGTTTITATSPDNDTIYGTCQVTVKTYNVTVSGILQDEDGNPELFTWDMENDSTWKKAVDVDNNLNAATYGWDVELIEDNGNYSVVRNDDVMYQMNTSGYLYKVDPGTGETKEASAATAAFGAPVDDMEYAYVTSQVFGQDTLFGVYGYYFLYSYPAMANTFDYGWNMYSYLKSYTSSSAFTTIAWVGSMTNNSGNTVDMFCMLTDNGYLWYMAPDLQTGNASLNYVATDLDLDFPGYNDTCYCSMVMGDDGNLYLSYFDGSTNQIYVLEYNSTTEIYESILLGDVGEGVWPASLLTVTSNQAAEASANSNAAAPFSENMFTVEAEAITLPSPEVTGGLNAVQASAETQGVEDSGVVAKDQQVTVTVTESDATSNGKYVITYDPTQLELLSCNSLLKYYSYNDDNGTITFAFANKTKIDADNTLATLKFQYVDENYVSSTITITTEERNNDTLNPEEDTIDVDLSFEDEPNGHSWVIDEDASYAPTCTETGLTVYKCEHCGETRSEQVNGTGHDIHLVGYVKPTGTSCGYSGDYVCRICGEVICHGRTLSALSGSTSTVTSPYIDVDVDDDAFDAIKYLYDNGIMDGVGDGKFDPNATLTRAMVVTILYRLDGKEAVTFTGAFSDVSNGLWYSDAVEWAAKYEIVNGMGDGTFAPNGNITREQLAAILQRYAQYKNLSTSASTSLNSSAQVSDWAKENVQWAVALDLLAGGKSVNATANATRAEVAVAIYNFILKLL